MPNGRGREVGIPLKQYIDSTFDKLLAGEDEIIVHAMIPGAPEIAASQRENTAKLVAMMTGQSRP